MIYHISQLLLCSVIAQRIARRQPAAAAERA
jgi:hypothetical protein